MSGSSCSTPRTWGSTTATRSRSPTWRTSSPPAERGDCPQARRGRRILSGRCSSVVAVTTAPDLSTAEPPVSDWSLSPSRALDFKTCALLYRFRVIDQLPEAPGLDAARGTVIHGVLQRLL